jgi:hypothetical protein
MTYEVWSIESGNLLASYSTREEAEACVEECVKLWGEEYRDSLAIEEFKDE